MPLCLIQLLKLFTATSAELGIEFDKHAGGLPILKLPYGKWRAHSYNSKDKASSLFHKAVLRKDGIADGSRVVSCEDLYL